MNEQPSLPTRPPSSTANQERMRKQSIRRMTKHSMPMQDAEERIKNFLAVELGYSAEDAWCESNRCVICKDPGCIPLCPVEIDIRSTIDHMKKGDYEAAYQVVTQSNLFPAITGRVCPQESQCEAGCVRGKKGESVGIGFLEKFLGDWARENSIRPNLDLPPFNGKRVAIIGSGPAGMSASADLVRMGYRVTIFEALHRPGGVLIYGIPEFRLPNEIIDYELSNLQAMGVEIVVNCLIGRTLTMEDLCNDHDAIFIGTGAGLPYFMDIPGEQLAGVYSANEFLTRANLMEARRFPEATTPVHVGKRVAVVGGGNVATDAARVALRIGAKHVDIIYRRTREEMPARRDEVDHAVEEGINLKILHAPLAIFGDENGSVKEVELQKMELGEPDDSGRRRPIPLEGTNHRVPYDVVVMAIGQAPNPLLAKLTPGLETTRRGNIVIEKSSLKVTLKENTQAGNGTKASPRRATVICAGGDIIGTQAGAGGTVIAAMGHGKVAARTIHKALHDHNPLHAPEMHPQP